MFILIALALLIFIIFLYENQKKSTYRWKKLSEFPGDAPLPFFGNSLQLGFDADGMFHHRRATIFKYDGAKVSHKLMRIWERHGKQNFRLSIGSQDWIMLSDADDVGTLLNHPTELSKPLERNNAWKPFFGNSISSSEDTLMGVDSNLLSNPDHPYVEESGKVIKTVTQNYFSYWRNIRLLFELSPHYHEMMQSIKIIRNTSANIIKERKIKLKEMKEDVINNNKNADVDIDKLLNNKVADSGCLLDKLLLSKLSNGDPIPEDMINDEITLVCYTGHYTTSTSISHTLYCLAKYPEIQNRVMEEQCSIFKKDLSRKPTNQDLIEMKYLEAVVKETIRCIPTATKIGRQLHEDLHFKDGRVAPAGSSVTVFYEAIYQNPKLFPEPEKYNPERFFDNMHNFAFVPFSAGPRNCIGFRLAWVAMKATLSNILRRYEVFPCDPVDEPQFAYRIVTESKNGMNLKFKTRVL